MPGGAKSGEPTEAHKKKMGRVLNALKQGMTIESAMALVGNSRFTFYQWQKRYPWFKGESLRVMARRESSDDLPQVPFNNEFREQHFGHAHHSEGPFTPPHMQHMMDLINDLRSGQWGLILVPPGHAKSALLEDYVCYRVSQNPQVRIYYISKTLDRAKMSIGAIQDRLTNYDSFPDFIQTYGPFRDETNSGRPWTQNGFTVAKKDRADRHLTVKALGLGGQLTGMRADIIILDDIVDVDNQSESDVEKQYEWVYNVANTRLVENGRIVAIGTRQKPGDLYERLLDSDWFHKTLILPAIVREPLTNGEDDPGEFLWPDNPNVTPERLLDIRGKDPRRFELIYQQNPLPTEGAAFPIDTIESCYDESLFLEDIPRGYVPVVGVDPSVTQFTAAVVMAVNPRTKHRILVDVWNEKGLTGDGGSEHAGIVQFITEVCKKYRPAICTIEDVTWTRLVWNTPELRVHLSDMGTRLDTYTPGPQGNAGKGGEDDRLVMRLSNLFANKLISIPYAGWSKGRVKEFVGQFARFDPKDKKQVRDIVKATMCVEHAAQKVIHNQLYAGGYFDDPTLPPYLQAQQQEVLIDAV